jgi:pyruvate,water dikinase
MWLWRHKKGDQGTPESPQSRVRQKYHSFRELLSVNNECLELMAGLQQDLQYAPPRGDVVGDRIAGVFDHTERVVASLEKLTGRPFAILSRALISQRREVERHLAALQKPGGVRLAAWLSEIDASSVSEVGSKAAELSEVKNRLGLPVPNGFVLTTEAYRQFCEIPLWTVLRDSLRDLDLEDPSALTDAAAQLIGLVEHQPIPRAVEVALTERVHSLARDGRGLAVRSSGVGEGESRTYAGQFLSLLNVPPDEVVSAFRRVVAARFTERALFYRLSSGLLEVDTPLAVLVLPMIPAQAAGIMYTRDPADPKSKELWITATRGLGVDIAGGGTPADLFVVSRKSPHKLYDRALVSKQEEIVMRDEGGIARVPLESSIGGAPSLDESQLGALASMGVLIEEHFQGPRDIEWALDHDGKPWILQTRPLALAAASKGKTKAKPKGEPLLSGGRTIYPGLSSGPAFLVETAGGLNAAPPGTIVFVRRASPEIVRVLPRAAGLVAEWGNITGHAAALLREFRVPSVFLMQGAFERLKNGDPVSLDAVQTKLYAGTYWQPPVRSAASPEERREHRSDPVHRCVLALSLLDPMAANFRPSGCKSAHDVLRYCHEKAVEAMFEVNDLELQSGAEGAKKLDTSVPVDLRVLDLGGGLGAHDPKAALIDPSAIRSRPFQSLWRGISHPEVTWVRDMPASLGDLASVVALSVAPYGYSSRPLGEKSYLLVADEYLNLNARLAYHYTLVDACLTDTPGNNYIAFRFAGGGATHERRNLRARFVDECLTHFGFKTDRRGDLVNCWFKKAPAKDTGERLDILGRLMACTSQLDMYMNSPEVMKWYVQQFLAGNYRFRHRDTDAGPVG